MKDDNIDWNDVLGGIDLDALATNDDFFNNGVSYREHQRQVYMLSGAPPEQVEWLLDFQHELMRLFKRETGYDLRDMQAAKGDPFANAMLLAAIQGFTTVVSAAAHAKFGPPEGFPAI